MKRTLSGAWAGVVCLLCAASLAAQQADFGQASPNLANSFSSSVPRLVKFSGALKDLTGKPLSGPVEITFAIYKEQGDAAPLWQETQTVALDEQGRYTVLLGAMQGEGLPMELFATGGARWLGIQAQGAEAQPRVLLVSVPYALKAGDAETLSGKPVSDFVLAQQLKEQVQTEVAQQAKKQQDRGQQALAMVLSQGPTPMLTTQGQTSFTCPSGTSGDCVTVTQRSTGRALYALANSSAEALRVNQNGTGYGLLAVVAASGAVYGVSTATTGSGFAIRGESASTGGRGILGLATATTGGTIGLWGNAASTGGTGVLADATATTGMTYGLRGRSYSSSGTGILAYAMATTGTTKGLWVQVYSAAGTAAVFQNTASGKLVSGVVGTGTGTEVFSVAGNGNLVSAGSLTGTSGNFNGTVTAASFTGNGSGLTNVAAATAATAATATNALALGGLAPSAYAPATGSVVYLAKAGDTMVGALNLPANGLVAGTNQLVLSGGKVGVGTATPGQMLEVAGTVKATAFSGDGSALTNINANQVAPPLNLQQVALLKWYPANQAAAFAVGSGPYFMAFDGANIWVTNANDNTVTKLRASDGANLGNFAVGTNPIGVTFDGANIWVANRASNNVTKLRASDGANVGTFPVGANPQGVAFDGANIWVANRNSYTVTKLRASDGANLGNFAVGNQPAGVAFDGANIWVGNSNSNNVTKLRASDGGNLGTFAVGTSPYGVAFDGANIWVANSASNMLSKL